MNRRLMTFAFAGALFAASVAAGAAQSKLVRFDTTADQKITGVIDEVIAVSDADGNVGLHLTVKTPAGRVAVRVGPAMFVGMSNFSFFADDEVEIVGNAMTPRSTTFIARQITTHGRTLVLRDETGAPLWNTMLEGSDGCGIQHVANADGTH